MTRILFTLAGLLMAFFQAEASGVFELRLLSFENDAGKDDLGKCCNGKSDYTNKCHGICRPRFKICLKEYQTKIDTASPCTFGDVITSNLGTSQDEGVNNLIAFPIQFTWPGSFSLIIEAWHGNDTSHSVLVSRITRQTWLDVGEIWTPDVHSSKFSTMKFEYRVTCDAHYYGKGCETLCRPRNDGFGHFSCSPTGDRICLQGWTGDYCTKAQCLPGCDELHGHCSVPNECRCQLGWEGALCNECQRYPGCMHGTCSKPWDCLCNEGWGGLFCNQDLNFCTNHKPCQNDGTCFNTGQGSYTCNCPAGYTGKNCEESLYDCLEDACFNGGTCFSSNNTCSCPRGYSGPRCETSAVTCDDFPCENGGTCATYDGDYKCRCNAGYFGRNCEQRIVAPPPPPCQNGGTRMSTQCICASGFTGANCEVNIDDCTSNVCQNGGTCIDKVNDFRCQCVSGFVGDLCQTRVDFCITKPCANGGSCLRLLNDYKCTCSPGFTGKDCSDEMDECSLQPCQNGGTCLSRGFGYECQCAPGFFGRMCEQISTSAAPSARVSESNLTTEHVVVIATISTFVPLLVLVAVIVIICLKQHRKREKARADEEARLQNEQNTANSSFAKRGAVISAAEGHIIKNSWGKSTNNMPDACSVSNVSVTECDGFVKPFHQVIDGRPVYNLQRSRSQKQLNTDSGSRASALLVAKLNEPDYEHIKRLSVMSNASAVCASSDPKRSDKESNGVYVIEEHFHRRDPITAAGLFATEV